MVYKTRLSEAGGQHTGEGPILDIVVEWVHGPTQHTFARESQYNDWSEQIGLAFYAKHEKHMGTLEFVTDDVSKDVPADVVIYCSDSDSAKFGEWFDKTEALVREAKAENQNSVTVHPTDVGYAEFIQTYAAWRGYRCFVVLGRFMNLQFIRLHIAKICVRCEKEPSDASRYIRERIAGEPAEK